MKRSMMRKAVGVLAASALACGALAAPAFAADSIEKSGTSEVVVSKADPGQISVTIPQQIPVAADATGKFMTPDAEKTKMTNGSEFPVHVSKVEAKVVDDTVLNLVAKDGITSKASPFEMWMTVKSGTDTIDLSGYTTAKAVPTASQWEMAASSGALNLGISGALSKEATSADITGVHALDVVWTVAV